MSAQSDASDGEPAPPIPKPTDSVVHLSRKPARHEST
jgi:hypothetical protein